METGQQIGITKCCYPCRLTRVGIVKWRGWHGNRGADGSPDGGVPDDEREKVEACLMPFHCVPVWVEPAFFGEVSTRMNSFL